MISEHAILKLDTNNDCCLNPAINQGPIVESR